MLRTDEIALAVAELAPLVEGGQLQRVREPDAETIALVVRARGQTVIPVLSVTPGVVRIGRAAQPPATLPEPSTLGSWVRSAGGGRGIARLRQLEGDRVVEVELAGGRLIAELIGRLANLYGVDASGRVVAVARAGAAAARGLLPGAHYAMPEARGDAASRPETPRFADAAAIERAAGERLARLTHEADAVARSRLLARARTRLTRLQAALEADAQRFSAAEADQRRGELLKTALEGVERGMTRVEVPDWYAADEHGVPTVEIALDPTLDGPANLARLFSRARKAKVGRQHVQARLAEVEASLRALRGIEEVASDAVETEAALRAAGLFKSPASGGPRRRGDAPRRPYRVWISSRGERIWVGRGGADNHDTTFKMARGNDHWLHVRDAPGAHVIAPSPTRGADAHPETLLDAAALAVTHSDIKDEPAVDVMLTRRKHVRAVPGAAPGRVTVADTRTLHVIDAADRVSRLQREI